MNMRIQGDGIALPKGVGESGKAQAGDGRERNQDKNKDAAPEKAKGDDAGGSKGPGIAITSPRPEKGQPADEKDGRVKDPAQDEGKDRGRTTPRPLGGESLSPKGADGKPAISGPRDEKEQDPVARRIDQGLERSPGAVRSTDLKVQGSGVAVPRCFDESREGDNC